MNRNLHIHLKVEISTLQKYKKSQNTLNLLNIMLLVKNQNVCNYNEDCYVLSNFSGTNHKGIKY